MFHTDDGTRAESAEDLNHFLFFRFHFDTTHKAMPQSVRWSCSFFELVFPENCLCLLCVKVLEINLIRETLDSGNFIRLLGQLIERCTAGLQFLEIWITN